MSIISAKGLHKAYGQTQALAGFDLNVEPGRIVGLIGPNGSGKTTALQAILGLNQLDAGELQVQGLNLPKQRDEIMQNTAYIADTGTLPPWMRVADLLHYVADVHPNFDAAQAQARLAGTDIRQHTKVRALSKGMQVQLHLAIVLAIDAQLLVLDEPTLGLDIMFRQQFYDALLGEYFNDNRSILITTHEVREIEHILTDVVFIHHGRTLLASSMDSVPNQFAKLTTAQGAALPPLQPLTRKDTLQGAELIFQTEDAAALAAYGAVATPNLAELFVALVTAQSGSAPVPPATANPGEAA